MDWQPIATAKTDEKVLLFAPAENLWEHPEGLPNEMRVACPSDFTWATHWMPLPPAPAETA